MFWRRKASVPAEHDRVVRAAASMTRDASAQALAARRGLQIVDLTWEDTARAKGSAYGPNISDMTIQVASLGSGEQVCMPVIRFPNFSDRSCDLALDEFYVQVGNERGAPLRRVPLRAYLDDLRAHLTEPGSWPGTKRSLLAGRDTHVLVSAQACFLPVPREGLATFTPVLFNYQSSAGDPAVLTVLVTREGTSATIIDNVRDSFAAGRTSGQRLYFNQAGQRAPLTGQRVSDFVAEQQGGAASPEAIAAARAAGLNTVLLIQVPLRRRRPEPTRGALSTGSFCVVPGGAAPQSDVEEAVIGHGDTLGPFVEIDGVAIERDEDFPIRMTVQFYKATSNGALAEDDVAAISGQIERVYQEASYVGSLVAPGDSGRPTEWRRG